MSPPASTFGINTIQSIHNESVKKFEPSEDSPQQLEKFEKSKFAPKVCNSDTKKSNFSPITNQNVCHETAKSNSPPKDITNLQGG